MHGKIIKGIAGFYYVHTTDGDTIYECKAKGVFRKDKKKPLVGDDVEMDVLDSDKDLGNITELLPRKSELIRPAVANVDQALVIFSIVKPKPNFNLLDRFLIMMEQQGLDTVICFNKCDIDENNDVEKYCRIYESCGYRTITVSALEGDGLEELKKLLYNKTTTVAGPSGVGKSSIINSLQSGVVMETGQISEKIERGKHTTRHCELIAIAPETYILDTPGFSSLGLFIDKKEELREYYPEFTTYERDCKFIGCAHISEPVCGVKNALADGKISKMRYDNYCLFYEEIKQNEKNRY